MNRDMVRFVLGRLLIIIGLLMVPSIFVAVGFGEGWGGVWPFLIPMVLAMLIGTACSYRRPENSDFFMREGFAVVGLTWLLLSLFGAIPFMLSRTIPHWSDAIFESVSGFTTTGASVVPFPEDLPKSILFWRSFSHLIGGMGVLVFALAVMPRIRTDDVFIMQAEVPGPTFGKIRSRVKSTARVLYAMYLVLTLLIAILLMFGHMPPFEAFLNAFGAAGTGGFGLYSDSIAHYASPYIQYVLAIGMLLFGINFNLYYAFIFRRVYGAFKSEELRWYLGIIGGAVLIILLNTRALYASFAVQFREVFFTVVSLITTTGYSVTDFEKWPLLSHVILLALMFVGGMAGSTAGGLKVSRVALYIKSSLMEIKTNMNPKRRLQLRFEGKPVSPTLRANVHQYLAIYILVFMVLFIIVSFHAPNMTSAFTSVAATFNNIGPGFDAVGPTRSYAGLSDLSKVTLSLGMIMGRLEIIPILVLFSHRTWRRI
ncbi:MAG: TrkH family potassium uptake protein [Saccharofermentanales bacterium]|jgi:trk system potassium uptake protein TrkH